MLLVAATALILLSGWCALYYAYLLIVGILLQAYAVALLSAVLIEAFGQKSPLVLSEANIIAPIAVADQG